MSESPATEVRIAVVQSPDGHLTCCGPGDNIDSLKDEMDAAMSWHLEAGHLPVARYWVIAEIPAPPTIPELRAKAEAGEFPKSFVEEMDRS